MVMFKVGVFVILVLGLTFFDRVRNEKCAPDETQAQIERRIEKMRDSVDSIYGDGFFDEFSSGKITQEELVARNITWVNE